MTPQQTLTGDTTEQPRRRPETMLYCEECNKPVLRSRRFDHEHELDPTLSYEQKLRDDIAEQVADQANLLTKTYEITFHDEYVERVHVEATNKTDAKERAELKRSFDGELIETVHTEKRAISEKSIATIEYLEEYNLLPDDHNLTQEDLKRVIDDD